MTNNLPSIEAFFAQPQDDDSEDGPERQQGEALFSQPPLESIASSLELIASAVFRFDSQHQGEAEQEREAARWREAHDDLDSQLGDLFGLIADIERALGKSTAKSALAAKAVIETWRNPQVEQTGADGDENAVEMGAEPPAHDAPVDEWRAFARSLGYRGSDIDSANRSQISSMLGLPHPGEQGTAQ